MADIAEKKVRLRIITPEEIKYDENVDMIIMRCATGDMGILPGHAPLSAALTYGVLRILSGGNERKLAVFGGLAEIRDNVVTILTNLAEWPEDINRARAMADLEPIMQLLQEQVDDIETQDDRVRRRRVLERVEVSMSAFTEKPEKNHKQIKENP